MGPYLPDLGASVAGEGGLPAIAFALPHEPEDAYGHRAVQRHAGEPAGKRGAVGEELSEAGNDPHDEGHHQEAPYEDRVHAHGFLGGRPGSCRRLGWSEAPGAGRAQEGYEDERRALSNSFGRRR